MWIKELRLSNIQSFQTARISLSKTINVIVGKNNTGKSTIIRSLLNFQSGQSIKRETLLRKLEESGFIIATLSEPKNSPTLKHPAPGEMASMIYDAGDRRFLFSNSSSSIPDDDKKLISYFGKIKPEDEILEFNKFQDFEPHNVFLPFLAKRKTPFINGQFDEKSIKSIDSDFRNIPSKLSRAIANTYSDQFKDACEEILQFVPTTIPGDGSANMTTVGQYVNFEETVALEQMGDGVTQIVGLLIHIFQARDKIFLIEEIENDLHPSALKALLGYIIMASQYNQFIISTHNNIVVRLLAEKNDSSIFETRSILIKDTKRKISLFKSTIDQIKNTPSERIRILNDLGYELVDSHLWSGYLILEESSAEKVIRDFLIPAFCASLDGRLKTIGAKGASDVPVRFAQLGSIFTYIHTTEVYRKKAWVCVDNDPAGQEAIKKLKSGFKDWDESHFKVFSKKDFEDYYPSEYNSYIQKIRKEADGGKRSVQKLDLAKRIVDDFQKNSDLLTEKFKESAKEIILVLREIDNSLRDKQSD